jgi:hypothetical protein
MPTPDPDRPVTQREVMTWLLAGGLIFAAVRLIEAAVGR